MSNDMIEEKEVAAILRQVQDIQWQLKVLEAQVRALLPAEEKPKRFSDLEGIWEGITDFSYEEIQQAKYKVKEFPT